MKITFMVTRKDDPLDSIDITPLTKYVDMAVRVIDSEEGYRKIVSICSENRPESILVIARDPLRLRDDRRINLRKRLIDTGTNPAALSFINLNVIAICTGNKEDIIERLLLKTDLAHNRSIHRSPQPAKKIVPIKRCLVFGKIPDDDALSLTGKGIEISKLLHDPEVTKTSPNVVDSLSGLPGQYRLCLSNSYDMKEEIDCGAIVINLDSLNNDQKQNLTTVMKIPFPDGEFKIPQDRYVLTTGIWLINSKEDRDTTDWKNEIADFLSQESFTLHLDSCTVDQDKCGLCGTCVKTCMFSANSINTTEKEISFDQTRCTGCGNCVTACPVLARDLPLYPNNYMFDIADNLQGFNGKDGVKILALFCENNGYQIINRMAAEGRRVSSSYFFLPVKCGARIGTEIVPDSFQAGYDGIALLVCARDRCNDLVGSLDLERRFNLYRTIMKAQRKESGRMRIFSVKQENLDDIHDGLQEFVQYLKDLKTDQSVFEKM